MSKQFSRIAVLAAIVGSSTFASAAPRPSMAKLRGYALSALRHNANTKAFKPWKDEHITMDAFASKDGKDYALFMADNRFDIIGKYERGGARTPVGTLLTGSVRTTSGKGKRVSIAAFLEPRVAPVSRTW